MTSPQPTHGRVLEILFIGDIVGRPGRDAVAAMLNRLRDAGETPDLVVANGENVSGGFGLTKENFHELLGMGVGVVTLGNHAWDKREILDYISDEDRLVRPLNYPEGTPGRGWTIVDVGGTPVGIINVMGRVFMPTLDCPFKAVDAALACWGQDVRVVLVDIHAEASAEKMGLGWHLDGRASLVVGTHTHVQTADETILPGGTAYLTDAGMTGPQRSVIGMVPELAVRKMRTQLPTRLEVADGPAQFNGVRVKIEAETGRAIAIERLCHRPA
ncbi:MAG: TIGR00282 family metallophosphoesterase [Candidatus Sericytochromatia bacterium]